MKNLRYMKVVSLFVAVGALIAALISAMLVRPWAVYIILACAVVPSPVHAGEPATGDETPER